MADYWTAIEWGRARDLAGVNALVFWLNAATIPLLAWWVAATLRTVWGMYPPSWWRDEGPADDRSRRVWVRRGRRAWALLAKVAATLLFGVYLGWWFLVADRAGLPPEAVAVHGARLAASLLLTWAYWPEREA